MRIKEGSKIKLPTLKSLIKRFLDDGLEFRLDNEEIEFNDFYIEHKYLGHTVEVISINSKNREVELKKIGWATLEDLQKLVNKDITLPEPATVEKVIEFGEILPSYDMTFFKDKSIKAGCQNISKERTQKLFEELADFLGYEIR